MLIQLNTKPPLGRSYDYPCDVIKENNFIGIKILLFLLHLASRGSWSSSLALLMGSFSYRPNSRLRVEVFNHEVFLGNRSGLEIYEKEVRLK